MVTSISRDSLEKNRQLYLTCSTLLALLFTPTIYTVYLIHQDLPFPIANCLVAPHTLLIWEHCSCENRIWEYMSYHTANRHNQEWHSIRRLCGFCPILATLTLTCTAMITITAESVFVTPGFIDERQFDLSPGFEWSHVDRRIQHFLSIAMNR